MLPVNLMKQILETLKETTVFLNTLKKLINITYTNRQCKNSNKLSSPSHFSCKKQAKG